MNIKEIKNKKTKKIYIRDIDHIQIVFEDQTWINIIGAINKTKTNGILKIIYHKSKDKSIIIDCSKLPTNISLLGSD